MQSFGAFSVTVWFLIMLSALFIMLMISCSKAFTKCQRAMNRKQKRFSKLQSNNRSKILRTISAPVKMKKRNETNILSARWSCAATVCRNDPQEETIRHSLSVATLTLMLLILSFYVSFFFIAIVKTDKVVLTKPPTIQSYHDIINAYPAKKTAFILNLNSHLTFAKADTGSKEWQIWQHVKREGLSRTLVVVCTIP